MPISAPFSGVFRLPNVPRHWLRRLGCPLETRQWSWDAAMFKDEKDWLSEKNTSTLLGWGRTDPPSHTRISPKATTVIYLGSCSLHLMKDCCLTYLERSQHSKKHPGTMSWHVLVLSLTLGFRGFSKLMASQEARSKMKQVNDNTVDVLGYKYL